MTTAAVQKLFQERAFHELCVMVSRTGKKARVGTSTGEIDALVAASCLLSPAPGDRVLVVRAGDEAYVLAVLEQVEPDARLVFERDVTIGVLAGKLNLMAAEGVDITSPKTLKVEVDKLETATREVSSKTKKLRVIAETFDTVASRIYQRAVNFLRRTDELDRVEAKNIERRAEQLFKVHGQNTIATAEELVKIDGSQVHVG